MISLVELFELNQSKLDKKTAVNERRVPYSLPSANSSAKNKRGP